MQTPFQPRGTANTVLLDVTSSSQAIALSPATAGQYQCRVMNNGTATAWIAFGDSTVAAAVTTGIPVGPGVTEVFSAQEGGGAPYAAAIAAGSTGKIYFTLGSGV